MATIKDLLSSMISKINSKISTWEEIPDKPFGTKTEMVEIYPETGMSVYPFSITTGFDGELIPGKKYTVVFNNVPVVCEAYSLPEKPESWPDQYEGAVFLGNQIHAFSPHIFPNPVDTGEDFLFVVQKSGAAAWDLNQGLEKFSKVTLKILEEQEIAQPLDYKFMPEGYPSVKTEIVEIVPEQSVTVTGEGALQIKEEYTLIAGNKYAVNFNGTTFTETAVLSPDTGYEEDSNIVYIGANFILGTNMDKPFGIMNHPAMGRYAFVTDEKLYNSEIALSIVEEKEEVKPIDIKYLPIEELKKALGIGGVE